MSEKQSSTRTIKDALNEGVAGLSGISPSPGLDAQLLLSFVLARSRVSLLAHDEITLTESQISEYRELLGRRKKYEPVAYIVGEKEFWGLRFKVDEHVLIPRPETEVLVEHAVEFAKASSGLVRVLDLGTGSGCIAIALAWELLRAGKDFHIVAVDSSVKALAVAKENAQAHLPDAVLSESFTFKESDWFTALSKDEQFNLIVSNPPYVREGDPLVSPETVYEPYQALYSGDNGLEAVKAQLYQLRSYLAPRGMYLCEIGAGQSADLERFVQKELPQFACSFLADLADIERVLVLEEGKPPPGES